MKRSGSISYAVLIALTGLLVLSGCGGGGGGGGDAAAPSAPSAFDLITPANNAAGVSVAPALTWQAASGAASYTLQIATDAGFTAPLAYENTALVVGTTSFTLPAGTLTTGTTYYWRVIAINAAGQTAAAGAPFSFTTAFASGASVWSVASNPGSGSFDEAFGMAKDPQAVYTVGYDSTLGYREWRIEKRQLADGTLVSSFGTSGVVTSNTGTRAVANAIAVDSAYMYVVGYDTLPGNREWRIEKRNLIDGSLVTSFGPTSSGVVSESTLTTNSEANAIAIDSAFMYVAGYDSTNGNPEWRIEKRNLSDGSLVTSFNITGIVTSNPSTGDDRPNGIAIDGTFMYVVGFDASPAPTGDDKWRIEKRSLATGALDTGFGSGTGFIVNDVSASLDEAYAIAIDATYMYVVGYDSGPTLQDDEWRIEKRNLSDGALVYAVQENPSSVDFNSADDAHAIAIDANFMYVTGFDSAATAFNGEEWRTEKRNLSDGTLVTSFGTNGIVTSYGNASINEAWAIVVDGNNAYVAGSESLSSIDRQWHIEARAK
jgi:hypothetical protein